MLTLLGLASLATCIWFLMGLGIEWGKVGPMLFIAIVGSIIFGLIAFICLT